MISLVILLVAAQVPAVPGEGTLVSFCKQGRITACQELAKTDPQKAAEIQAALAKGALGHEALRRTQDESQEQEEAESNEAEADTSDVSYEPPNCTGQTHHIISRPISEELERHRTLRGLFKPRDERFKTQAKDKESHCGYQEWHRKVDLKVIEWLKAQDKATPEQFLKMLRELYSQPDLLKRFPHGF
jgi:hypothetical protein